MAKTTIAEAKKKTEAARLQAREYQRKMKQLRLLAKRGKGEHVDSTLPSMAGFRPCLE